MNLRELLELVEESLDEPDLGAAELAGRAYLSRYHFDRLVSAALGEPPGTFRRRLLLERAAYRLASSTDAVIDIAAEAGYASPDAFARAFARNYATTPTGYRRRGPSRHQLPTENGIHFHPPGGLRLPPTHRSDTMDVLTRMYEHHIELTGAILDRFGQLADDTFDRPIELSVEGIDNAPTLRSIGDRLVRQLEMWVTAVEGGTSIAAGATDATALRSRLDSTAPRFRTAIVEPIRAGRGGEEFVDATCEPPQTFTLGGVLAHVLTFAAARRTMAIGALESAGITDLGAGDPMEFVGGSGPDASTVHRNFD